MSNKHFPTPLAGPQRYVNLFEGLPRDALERLAKQLLDNLASTQARCSELLLENRELKAGIVLPGWHCPACSAFCGTAKENLPECRCCGTPRPQ